MDFAKVLNAFTAAVETGDGAALSALFTEEGVYHDGFYGAFRGRAAIAEMLEEHFWGAAKDFKWDMLDPAMAGQVGYARYLFSYISTLPESEGQHVIFDGMACFHFENGLITEYFEIFEAAVAQAQIGFAAERIAKFAARKARRLRDTAPAAAHLSAVQGPTHD